MVYPFLPAFGRGLGVDLRTISLAVTLRSASGIFGPILASIADQRGRKVGMLIGLSLFTAGVGMMVIRPSFTFFVLSLILCLWANLIFIPSMQAYLGDRIPYHRRGLVLALTEFAWSLSFIIGIPLVGLVMDRYSWKTPFSWFTGLGVLAIIVVGTILPKNDPNSSNNATLGHNLHSILAYSPALAGILFGMTLSGANEMISLIFGVWLEDAFNVKIATLAITSAIIGLSELGGETLVGGFVDRLGKHRAVAIGLVFNSIVGLALPVIGFSLTGAMIGLFLIYLTFEFTIVSSIILISEVLPTARATYLAAFVASTALGRTLGDLLAPPLYQAGVSSSSSAAILNIVLVAAALNVISLILLRVIGIPQSEIPSL